MWGCPSLCLANGRLGGGVGSVPNFRFERLEFDVGHAFYVLLIHEAADFHQVLEAALLTGIEGFDHKPDVNIRMSGRNGLHKSLHSDPRRRAVLACV